MELNEKNILISDKPESQGAANVLKRAAQLCEMKWKPLSSIKPNQNGYLAPMKNGCSAADTIYTGLPYSSARVLDKFIGIDVSIETFMTALQNPASVLYTRDLSDPDDSGYHINVKNAFLFYGIVCSSFVNYALGLPIHRSTWEWGSSPEFEKIEDQSTDALKLCDTLVTIKPDGSTGGHVRMVTGISRNTEGKIIKVEISEGYMPLPKRAWYSYEEVSKTLLGNQGNYVIYRCKQLRETPYTGSKYVETDEDESTKVTYNRVLGLNYGNKANYRLGETVEINIMSEDADDLILEKRIGTTSDWDQCLSVRVKSLISTSIFNTNYTIYSYAAEKAGDYRAYCIMKDGTKSEALYWKIAAIPAIKLTRENNDCLSVVNVRLTDDNGSALTKESPILYDNDGKLLSRTSLGLVDENGLVLAHTSVGLNEDKGKIFLRTAAVFTDQAGKRVSAMNLDDNIMFSVLTARMGSAIKVTYSGGMNCTPYYISWMNEDFISLDKRMLTREEIENETALVHCSFKGVLLFKIFYKTEYGLISSDPVTVLIT